MAKKPQPGFGPIGDDLFAMIQKAMNSLNKKKAVQGNRVMNRLVDRGGMVSKKNSEVIFKSRYPKTGPGSKYRKDYPEEALEARTNKQKLQQPRIDAKKKATKKASEQRAAEAALKRKQNDARIIKEQERTLRATRMGDAAADKGSKLKGGRETPMSKKDIDAVKKQGRLAGESRKKGNAAKKLKAQQLDKEIKNAKNATERRAAMQRRRKFRDDTGF